PNAPPPSVISTLSLHDALPISAPKGTTMRMGLFDRGWAWLVMAASSRAAQARALRVKRRLFMGLLSPGRRVWRKSAGRPRAPVRSEEHTSELQSLTNLVCRLLL